MAKLDSKQLFWATGIDNTQLSLDKTEAVNIFKRLSTEVKAELTSIKTSYKELQNLTKEKLSLGVSANEIKLIESQMRNLDMLINKQIASMQKMGTSYESAMQKINSAAVNVGKGVTSDPLKQTVQNVHNSVARADSDLSYMEKIFKRAGAYLVAYGTFSWTKQLVSDLITVKGQFDQLRVSMDSFIGDAKQGEEVFQQLTDLAVKSPFQLLDITDSAKQLLAYGVAAEDVTRRVKQLSDVSAGSGQSIKDIAYLYGTSLTQGRLYARDLFQFANRGIPIYKELAAVMGISTERLMNMVKAGQVGFPELEKAFDRMTDKGGKYAGLSDKLAETTYGKISNLKDKWTIALNEMGTDADGVVQMGVEATTTLITNWREVAKAIEAVVIAYGTYKAATAIGSLVLSTTTYAANYAEAKSLEVLIPLQMKEALAKQGMVIGSAEYVAALRAEAAAQVSSSSAIVLSTTSELVAIRSLIASKEAAIIEETKLIAQKKIAFGFIMAEGDANAIAAAKTELNTIQKRINTYASEKNVLLNKAAVLSRQQEAAATATQTTTTVINTAATQGNAASKSVLTVISTSLTKATMALNAAISANPYTAALVVLVAITTAMWYFYDSTTAAEKALKNFNEAQDAFKKKQEDTRKEIDKNISIMQDESETTAAKEFAYKRLTELSPSLTSAYSREKIEVMNLAAANKILNEERDRESYTEITNKVNELTSALKKLNGVSGGGYNPQDARGVSNEISIQENERQKLQEELQLYKNLLAEWDKAVKDARPLDIKIGDAKTDLKKITDEFDEAKKVLDIERDKLAKNKFYVIPFEIELRYTRAEKAKINQEAIVKNLMGGVDSEESFNKAYYENLKNKAEEDFENMSNKLKGTKAWNDAKALIVKYENILKEWDTNDTSARDDRNKEARLRREEEFKKEVLQIKTDTETSLNEISEKSYAKSMQMLENENAKKLEKIKLDSIELNKKARAIGVDFDASGNVKIKGKKATDEEKATMQAMINLNKQKENENANYLERKATLERDSQDKIDKINYDTFKSFSSELDKEIFEISEKYRKMAIEIRENAKPEDISSLTASLGISEDIEKKRAYLNRRKELIEYNADIATQRNNANQIDNTLLKSKAQTEIDIEIEKNKALIEENQSFLDMIQSKREELAKDPSNKEILAGLDAQSNTYSEIIRKLKIVSGLEEERLKKQKNDDLVKNLNDAGSALGKLGDLASQFDEELGKTLKTAGSLASGIGGLLSSLSSGNILGAVGSAAGLLTNVVSLFDDSEDKARRAAELKRQEKGYWDAINNSIQTQKDLIDSLATSLMGAFSGTTLEQYQYQIDMINSKLNATSFLADKWKSVTWINDQPLTELQKEASESFLKAFDIAKNKGTYNGIKVTYSLFSMMTTEEIIALQGISAIWSKLDESTQEYINQLAEAKKSQDEFINSLKKSVTGFDFSVVSDGLIDALNSSEDSAEVWADNMKDIIKGVLQQAMVSQFLKKQIEDQIDTYYNGLTKASTDYASSAKTEEAKKALSDAQAQASATFVSGMSSTLTTATDMWKTIEGSLSSAGLDLTTTSSNNSTASAIKNITSEQADLLSAQATSMRINISDIRMDVGKILLYLQNNGNNIDSMSMTIAHQTNILEIAGKDIQEIAVNTRDLASIKKSLNSMVEYGIKVK